MKINWDQITADFGSHSHMVDECKDTDYDTDGGFWDSIGDWFGEDFDYNSVNIAVGNFYNCCAKKVAKVIYAGLMNLYLHLHLAVFFAIFSFPFRKPKIRSVLNSSPNVQHNLIRQIFYFCAT